LKRARQERREGEGERVRERKKSETMRARLRDDLISSGRVVVVGPAGRLIRCRLGSICIGVGFLKKPTQNTIGVGFYLEPTPIII
jgi:hypothetical protein